MRSLPSDASSIRSAQNGENQNCLITFEAVSFKYSNSSQKVLENISIEILRGKKYALVGPSGAGKTTFIDICMGILDPSSGLVTRNFTNEEKIAYVPQDSPILRGSAALNISLEWNEICIDQNKVKFAIDNSAISDFLNVNPGDLSPSTLSGGQKQRIGIARAVYRQPTFLVLDESTSALDSETEFRVMSLIDGISSDSTVLIIAHRLSTIKDVDFVIYFEEGCILGVGTFTELRKTLPQFESQIQLGLIDPI
jgi:ABC-type multidrug transport system fused ATPase/permease subunit